MERSLWFKRSRLAHVGQTQHITAHGDNIDPKDVVPFLTLEQRKTFVINYRRFQLAPRPSPPLSSDPGDAPGPSSSHSENQPIPPSELHADPPASSQSTDRLPISGRRHPMRIDSSPSSPPALTLSPRTNVVADAKGKGVSCMDRSTSVPDAPPRASPPRITAAAKGKGVNRPTTVPDASPPRITAAAKGKGVNRPTTVPDALPVPPSLVADRSLPHPRMVVEVPPIRQFRSQVAWKVQKQLVLGAYTNLPLYRQPAVQDGRVLQDFELSVRALPLPFCKSFSLLAQVAPGMGCVTCAVAIRPCNMAFTQGQACHQCTTAGDFCGTCLAPSNVHHQV